jgi:chromosomal replication initiation ATPase DnaA
MTSQFVLPFASQPAMDAATFITAPCNEQAFRFITRWPDWPAPAAALYGPAGCGKTHLTTIWRDASGARVLHARELASAFMAGEAGSGPAIIEDLDLAPADASRDRVLIELFDCRNPMLLTGRTAPSQWNAATGDWKSRLQSLVSFELWSPDDVFLSRLVRRHFAERQLDVPAPVVKRILNSVERTPAAIARFIDCADRRALSEKRPISLRLVMQLLGDSEPAISAGSDHP